MRPSIASDANNQVTRFAYDRDGRLRFTVDALGSISETVYDVPGNLVSTVRFAARPTLTQYSESAIDAAVNRNDAGNQVTRFAYDRDGRLRFTVDALGSISETVYDALGHVASTVRFAARPTLSSYTEGAIDAAVAALRSDAGNQVTRFAYDADNRLRFTVDALGSVSETVYDALGQVVSTVRFAARPPLSTYTESEIDGAVNRTDANNQVTHFAYDRDGRLRFTVDALGSVSETVYDALGNVMSTVRFAARPPLSDFTESVIDGAVNRDDTNNQVTRFAYDRDGRLRFTVDALGSVSETVYDALGHVASTVRFAARPTLSTHTETEIDAAVSRDDVSNQVTRFAYDRDGRVRFAVDALGSISESVYDALGNVVRTVRFAARPTLSTTYTENAINAAVNSLRSDARNQITRFAYDADNRLHFTVDALGSISETVYDALGSVVSTIRFAARPALSSYTESAINTAVNSLRSDANNQITRFAYDADNRLRFTVDALGSVSETVYDALGNVASTLRFAARPTLSSYSESAINTAVNALRSDAGNQITRFAYDADNRLRFTVDALGSVSETVYDALGHVVSTVRFAARPTLSTYTESEIDGAVNRTDANNQVTRFAYDRDGRLRFTVDALGSVSETVYDALGNVMSTVRFAARPPLSDFTESVIDGAVNRDDTNNQVTRFAYDRDGRLRFTVDALGSVSETVYDALGNVASTVRYAARPPLSTHTETEIDAAVSRDDVSNQVTRFAYDAAGRQIFSMRAVSVETQGQVKYQVSRLQLNALGQVVSSTAYATAVTLSAYDEASIDAAVDAVADATKDRTSGFAYDAAGRLIYTVQVLRAGKHQVVKQEYDAQGRVFKTTGYVREVGALTNFNKNTIDTAVNAIVDVNDRKTQYVYDAAGYQRFVLQADNDTRWTIGESRYDAKGNLIESRRYDQFVADTWVAATDTASSPGITEQEMSAKLSALGYDDSTPGTLDYVRRTRFAYDAQSELRFEIDALGAISERTYNALGQLVSSTRYAVTPVLVAYDESAINAALTGERNNANNQLQQYAYNAVGQLRFSLQVLKPNVGTGGEHRVSEQRYDALGQLVETRAYATAVGHLNGYGEETIAASIIASDQDRRSAIAYDANGRQVYTAQELQVGSVARYVVTRQVYDALGQMVQRIGYATPVTLADFDDSTIDSAIVTNSSNDRTTTYVHDAAGRLRFEVASDGSFRETVYDALNQVTQTRQFDFKLTGNPLRTEAEMIALRGNRFVGDGVTRGELRDYDAAGRLSSVTDALNNIEHFEYNAPGERIKWTDKNGHIWTYEYDRKGQKFKEISPPMQFKLSGEPVGTPAPERSLETRFEFDAFGNLKQKVEAANFANDARTTDFSYDTLGRLESTRYHGYYDAATGRVEKDPGANRFRRETTTTYDTLGNAVRSSTRTGVNTVQHEYRTYDNLGQLAHQVNALNHVTGYTFTSFGEVKTVTRYSVTIAGTPADGVSWTAGEIDARLNYGVDEGGGIIPDSLARTITLAYDDLGRKVSVTEPTAAYYSTHVPGTTSNHYRPNPYSVTAAQEAALTKFEYNVFGDMTLQRVRIDNIVEWQDTSFTYDAMGRRIGSVDAAGFVTFWEYDAAGNLERTAEFTGSFDGSDRISEFAYNLLNQQTRVDRYGLRYTDADGNDRGRAYWNGSEWVDVDADVATTVRTTTYDGYGRVLTTTDGLGNVTTMKYNALGQLERITEPARIVAPVNANDGDVDPFRNQVSQSPVTVLTLDAFGNVRATSRSQDARQMLQSYDAADNLISTTDAELNVKLSFYDYAGRVIRETQAINSNLFVLGTNTQGLERRYFYDAIGQRTDTLDVYQDGDTLKQSGQSVAYNAFGEVIEELRKWGLAGQDPASLNKAKVASYHYDNAGHVFEKVAGDGLTLYFYNLQGQVTREEKRGNSIASDGTDKRITETQYDVLGRAIMIRKPGFNADLSIGSELQKGLVTPYSKMTLDRWGNVVNYEEGGYEFVDGHERFAPNRLFRSYQYDDNNQLTSESLGTHGFVSESGAASSAVVSKKLYRDLSGNVVKEVDEARNAQSDALLSSRTRRNEYNSVGQLTAQIDATNRRTEYAYNVHGDKLGTRNAEGTVTFDQYDKNGNVLFHGVLRTIGPDGVGEYNSFNGEGTITRTYLNAYLYDQANRRFASKTFTDATGAPWSLTRFDGRNFAVEHRDEAGVIKQCRYDQFGNKSEEIAGGATQHWTAATADYVVGRLGWYSVLGAGGGGGSYQYNDFGQIQYLGRGSAVTSYDYHANGLLRTTTITAGSEAPSGTETTVYNYDARGQLTEESRSDSDSIHTKYIAYDNQGRLARVEQIAIPGASAPQSDVSYSYDEFGNIRRIQSTYMQTWAEGLLPSDSWFKYDAAGRMTLANGRMVDGVISLKERTPGSVKIGYDEVGRRSLTTEFVRDNHTQNSVVDRRWDTLRHERYAYNDLGQLQMTEQRISHVNVVALWLNGFASPGEAGFVLIEDGGTADSKKLPTEDEPPPPPPDDDDGDPGPAESENEPDRLGAWQMLSTRITNLRGDVTRGEQWDRIDGNLNSLDVSEIAAHSSITNTSYRADGQVDWTETIDDDPTQSTRTDNTYDVNSGRLSEYRFTAYNSAQTQHVATFRYQYTFRNGNWLVQGINDSRSNLDTTRHYDDLGRMYHERIDMAKPNGSGSDRYEERRYKYDAEGRIIVKDTTLRLSEILPGDGTVPLPELKEGMQVYVYAGDRTVATVGNGRLAAATKFDFAYTPMSEAAISGSASYLVQSGDTLIDIAQKVYGDGSLWYIIADANGVTVGPHDPLPTAEIGKAYDTPSVTRHANNAATFKPYNAAEITGDGRPVVVAPPPAPRCSEIGTQLAQMVIIAVSMTVKYVTTGLLMYVGVPAPIAHGIGSGLGNLAGQGTAWALGMQEEGKEGIDWGEVGLAAAEGYYFSAAGNGPATAIGKEVWQQNKTGFENWGSYSGVASSLFNIGMNSLSPTVGDTTTGLATFVVNGVVNSASPNSGWAAASGQRSSLVSGFEVAFGAFANGAANMTYEWIREQMKKPSAPRSADDPRGPLSAELLDEWDERDAVHGRMLDHLDKQWRENEPIAEASRRNLRVQLEMADLQDRIDHLGEGIDERAVMKYALNANNRERSARQEAAAAAATARAQAREAMFNARAARLDAQMKAGQRDYLAQIESDMNESLHIIAQDLYDEGTLTRVSDNIEVDGVKVETSSGVYDPQMIFSDRLRNWELDVAVDWFKNNSKQHDMKMHEVIRIESISSSAEKARRAGLRDMPTWEQHKTSYLKKHNEHGTLEGALQEFNSDRRWLSKDVDHNDYRMANAFATANFITATLPGLALGPISTLASMGVGYGATEGLEALGVDPQTASAVGSFAGMFVGGAIRGGGVRLVDDLNSGGLVRGLMTATVGSAVMNGLERAGVDQTLAGLIGGVAGGLVGGRSVRDLTRPSGSVEGLLAAQRAARALAYEGGSAPVSGEIAIARTAYDPPHPNEPKTFVQLEDRQFDTMDEAARHALDTANPHSIRVNAELGGDIYQAPNGRYGYTGPILGGDTTVDTADAPVPSYARKTGNYHTHGDYSRIDQETGALVRTTREQDVFAADEFSQGDRVQNSIGYFRDGAGYTGYLGTPSGRYLADRVYDVGYAGPVVLSDPALPPASRGLPVAGESQTVRPEQPAVISAPTPRDVFFAVGVTRPLATTPVPTGNGVLSEVERLGYGFFKDVYPYGDGKAIGVIKPDKMLHSGVIIEELENLGKIRELFADTDLPHVNASGPVFIDGRPAIVMDRFAQGSKAVVRVAEETPWRDGGRFEVLGDSPYLNHQSLRDLATIRDTLIAKKADIPDLQFLIARSGRLAIADPLGPPQFSQFAPDRSHLQLIEKMEEAARRSIYLETGLATIGGLHKKASNDGYW